MPEIRKNLIMKTFLLSLLWAILPALIWAQSSRSSFLDNSNQPDSVTISGQIVNRTTQTVPRVVLGHIITDELIDIPISLDSLGNFRVKVPVFNTTSIYIHYVTNGSIISLFAEPGEQIFIHSDWKTNKVTFKGKFAKEHQEVYDCHSYLASINRLYFNMDTREKISHEQYLGKLKQLSNQNDSILNVYFKQHPEISKRSKEELQIGNYNQLGFYLMQRRFYLDRQKKEKFSKTYMDFADSLFKALPRPYTIASSTFLCDYLDYYGENQQKLNAYQQAMIDYAIQNKRIVPNEEQKKNLLLILQSKEYQSILSDIYNELRQSESFVRLMLDYYNAGALIVPMPTELKEIVTAQAFYKYLSSNRTALSEGNVAYFKKLVKSPTLRKCVLDYQNKLVELEHSKLNFSQSLKDNTSFKDDKTGEELFTRLIAPYKGKIIYLDIWGTWCSPCKHEMQFTGAIKEAMKGKDIVFLYLANGSSDTSWKNVIKENHLTGEQVEHYNLPSEQQDMIEKFLGVRSFPTYLVIDKEGKIINRDPMRPSRGQSLIDYLNKLLSK